MEGPRFRCFWVLLAVLVLRTHAACTSYGVDYSNGGTYNIDGSSNQYFSFVTVFQGCNQESINPVLVGPDQNEYACSAIRTQPAGTQVTSTCGIPYSAMQSGTWRIIVSGDQIATQRTVKLVVGLPQTTWITHALPDPDTYSSPPNRDGSMHWRNKNSHVLPPGAYDDRLVYRGQDGNRRAGNKLLDNDRGRNSAKREVAATAVVAAITSTYTQTTRTVTSTMITTIPGRTSTELILKTVTATIIWPVTEGCSSRTPAASTVCANGGQPGVTVTVNRGTPTLATETSLVYQTTHLSGTLYIGYAGNFTKPVPRDFMDFS
ncbi:hypothetical protein B0T24DRAFT_662358 [Lasiosphaeria ovina]|uniref:Uncharacterized protein n=1 Tax=Lasiosphaeria ovina TaxID=92902 RepID=A0AAE0TY62_9PEZI|nr:hypothetical protein B0T24DRAFT_662358 [Lasiosphaeria ovina]